VWAGLPFAILGAQNGKEGRNCCGGVEVSSRTAEKNLGLGLGGEGRAGLHKKSLNKLKLSREGGGRGEKLSLKPLNKKASSRTVLLKSPHTGKNGNSRFYAEESRSGMIDHFTHRHELKYPTDFEAFEAEKVGDEQTKEKRRSQSQRRRLTKAESGKWYNSCMYK